MPKTMPRADTGRGSLVNLDQEVVAGQNHFLRYWRWG
jgi:hypothetical protein